MNYEEPPHPFSTLAGLIDGFQPPAERFDPMGDWEQNWGVYSIGFGPARAGSLLIRRKSAKRGTALLEIDYRKDAPGGFINQTQARVLCRIDSLSTPLNWTIRYEAHDDAGQPVANTQLEIQGENKQDHIVLQNSPGKRSIAFSGSLTSTWCLFEAAHRQPNSMLNSIPFTFLDDFDQAVEGHSLSFREEANFPINSAAQKTKAGDLAAAMKEAERRKKVERIRIGLRGYEQTGPGILPTTYWIGEQGRLLFVISGIEAYVWERPNA